MATHDNGAYDNAGKVASPMTETIRVTYGQDRLGSRDYLGAHAHATTAMTYLAEAVGRLNRPENDETHPRVKLQQARACIDRALQCWEPVPYDAWLAGVGHRPQHGRIVNRPLVNRMLVAWDNSIYDQRDIPRRESAMAAALEVALAWERARIEEEIRLSWGSPEQMFADREILRIVRDMDDDAR